MGDISSDGFEGNGDEFYSLLMKTHEGLSDADSMRLNARLVLLLANQVGDIDILKKILDKAAENRA